MTVKQLNNRLDILINAHVWSRTNDKVKLNVYQRICLTQERAAIMQALDTVAHIQFLTSNVNIDAKKIKYQIPDHLNERVQQITNIINSTNWVKPKHEVEPY